MSNVMGLTHTYTLNSLDCSSSSCLSQAH